MAGPAQPATKPCAIVVAARATVSQLLAAKVSLLLPSELADRLAALYLTNQTQFALAIESAARCAIGELQNDNAVRKAGEGFQCPR